MSPITLITLFLGCSGAALAKNPLRVTLFYESYCPDCIQYFEESVMDAWRLFKNEFVLDLVPFGNAKQWYVDGRFKFQCQHGPKECLGNKLEACALLQTCGESGSAGCAVDKLDRALRYIFCLEEEPDQLKASDKCARDQGLDPEDIKKCAQNAKGDWLLSLYGNRTSDFRPKIGYVPTVAIDGIHDKAAEDNLVKEICTVRPEMCENIRNQSESNNINIWN